MSRCAVALCQFPPTPVRCARPGCVPDASRCFRHLLQRGCDACFAPLCDAHAIGCADCAEARSEDFFVEDLCDDCFARSDNARCSECGRVACESHFDSMFDCDECGYAHCHVCATFRSCPVCCATRCGKKCRACGEFDD